MLNIKASNIGLKPAVIENVRAVFSGFPQIEEVILFGSRAKGTYKPYSDIDLTLRGSKVDLSIQQKIELQLDDLLLPQKIDLSIYDKIADSSLLAHIDRLGLVFYRAE